MADMNISEYWLPQPFSFWFTCYSKLHQSYRIPRTTTTPPSQLDSPLVHELYDPLIHNGVTVVSTSPILYNMGGGVLTGATKIYILYYGSWNANQKTIAETFLSHVGTTSWFNIEKTYYYRASSTSPKVYIKGPKNGQVPNDSQGLYLLLSSSDVSEGSAEAGGTFCVNYCEYHLNFYVDNVAYVLGFIGNLQKCINGSGSTNPTNSPNGDAAVDAMVSVIAHELVDTMSDPFGSAWFGATGNENADKCAWAFGSLTRLSNSPSCSVLVGGRYYLIQQNWNANTQTCAMAA
ncbi:unnamed protein product [Rotaria socialis]|uniref:Uncharacterized protein n=1 Tax=Rotaria socialis TaxID=392032 RepID=A0A818B4V4_9BILA|nr:unnamed protein product [Rotaria socialis]